MSTLAELLKPDIQGRMKIEMAPGGKGTQWTWINFTQN